MTIKNSIFCCLLLLGTGACKKTETSPQPAQTNTVMQTPDTAHAEPVRKMFEAFNKHDWELMASYYSDPAEFLDPSLGKNYVKLSRAQLAKKYADLQKGAPDIKDDIAGFYISGEENVVVQFTSSGTSGGQKWSLSICTVFTVKDGKIMRDATYYDN